MVNFNRLSPSIATILSLYVSKYLRNSIITILNVYEDKDTLVGSGKKPLVFPLSLSIQLYLLTATFSQFSYTIKI